MSIESLTLSLSEPVSTVSLSEPVSTVSNWIADHFITGIVPVVALAATVVVAIGNYGSTERRHKDDVVRNAITDLTTGKVADARDELTKWVSSTSSVRTLWYEEYRSCYFELCWAYQRGDTARSVWRDNWAYRLFRVFFGKPHGRKDLRFHMQQIAVSAHQYHNHLRDEDDAAILDRDIWAIVGNKMFSDVKNVGINNPDSNASYDEYYAARSGDS